MSGDGNNQAFNDYYGIDDTINTNTSQKENVENDGESDTTADVENVGKEEQSSSSTACEKSTNEEDNNNPKVSMSPPKDRASLDNDDDESDIELLDPETYRAEQQQHQKQSASAAAAAAASTNNDNSDEELEVVGTHNEQKLPHMRIHCLDFRYKENNTTTTSSGTNDNAKFCSLCYCYVCDKPALECENWFMGEKGICSDTSNDNNDDGGGKAKSNDTDSKTATNATAPHNNHCNAIDKGGQKHLWKNMRTAIKDGKDPSNVSNSYQASDDEGNFGGVSHPSLQQFMANYMGGGLQRHRNHATSRGGARQRRSHDGSTSATSATSSTFGSTTYSAAASRSRSAPPPPRRRRQNQSGTSGSNKRPATHDHRARIRTQQMLEDLYG